MFFVRIFALSCCPYLSWCWIRLPTYLSLFLCSLSAFSCSLSYTQHTIVVIGVYLSATPILHSGKKREYQDPSNLAVAILGSMGYFCGAKTILDANTIAFTSPLLVPCYLFTQLSVFSFSGTRTIPVGFPLRVVVAIGSPSNFLSQTVTFRRCRNYKSPATQKLGCSKANVTCFLGLGPNGLIIREQRI